MTKGGELCCKSPSQASLNGAVACHLWRCFVHLFVLKNPQAVARAEARLKGRRLDAALKRRSFTVLPARGGPAREVGSRGAESEFRCAGYRIRPTITPMAKAKKFELESPVPILDEEDEDTLAAIDEGVRDAKAGRTVPAEEVRKRLPKWITASSTRKGR